MEYTAELKYDGVALSLVYQDGKLLRAVTRSDVIHAQAPNPMNSVSEFRF